MNTKNALIIGIRDEESICYAIATELKRAGCNVFATYQDASTYDAVAKIAENMGIKKLFAYDARRDEDLEAFTEAIKHDGIALDYLIHGISYSTASGAKLDLPLVNVTWEEFTDAIRVGAFSLVEICGKLLPVMRESGAVLTISLRWSRIAVPNFNVVSATKAALESMVRGLAQSLGAQKNIRVNGISPGFVPTYSLGKLGNTLEILEQAKLRSPLKRNVRKQEIATLAVSMLENLSITGMIYPIDTGVAIVDP